MRRALVLIATVVVSLSFSSCSSAKHVVSKTADISPYSYGLATARSGAERYQVLLETHRAAIKAGVNVDYTGIDTIRLEIPENPKRIPLTQYNDFKGCVFVVKNTTNKVYLFDKRIDGVPITVDKRLIDAGDFRKVEALYKGKYLLIIEDENLWVANRKGHDYGHTRKDILLVENGVAKNAVIMPYNNAYSNPKCTYVTLGKEPLVFKNITIERDSSCTFLTHITNISGADNVQFSNVIIRTPESPLTDDRGISIYNSTNVTMQDIHIEGTYSHTDHSGYGVFLNNVWNYKGVRLYGKANWGIFGNNNVNVARIEDSQINRFDIHCYGRDISFNNVDFFDLYNQYSSVYGTIMHKNCTFTNFVPVLNGGSYNSYVAHDVVFKDCVFNATPEKNYLLRMETLENIRNERAELSEKCFPNIVIKDLTVNMSDGTTDFYIFKTRKNSENKSDVGYLTNIDIDGLTINSNGETPVKGVTLSNINIQTKNPVDCQIKNVIVNQPRKDVLTKAVSNEAVLKTNMPIKDGKIMMKNVKNLKQ